MNWGRARAAMACIDQIDTGTVTMATTASSGEIVNIITATPMSSSTDVSIWLSVCWRLWATLSRSLVTRLSRSPRGLVVDVAEREGVELGLGLLPQPEHQPLHDAGEDVARCRRRAARRRRRARRASAASRGAPEVDARRCSPPGSMRRWRRPGSSGRATLSTVLATAITAMRTSRGRSGASSVQSRRTARAEVVRPLCRHAEAARPRGRAPGLGRDGPQFLVELVALGPLGEVGHSRTCRR